MKWKIFLGLVVIAIIIGGAWFKNNKNTSNSPYTKVVWTPISLEDRTTIKGVREIGTITSGAYAGKKLVIDTDPEGRFSLPFVPYEYYIQDGENKIYTFETGWNYRLCDPGRVPDESDMNVDCSLGFEGMEISESFADKKGVRYEGPGGPILPSILGNDPLVIVSGDSQGREIFKRQNSTDKHYFLRRADGTLVAYGPYISGILDQGEPTVAWNNNVPSLGTYIGGSINPDLGNCFENINAIAQRDLVEAGRASDGSKIYEPDLVKYGKAYACMYGLVPRSYGVEDFKKSHPVFFSIDGHGMIIPFVSLSINPERR